jgi:hypothetical protein
MAVQHVTSCRLIGDCNDAMPPDIAAMASIDAAAAIRTGWLCGPPCDDYACGHRAMISKCPDHCKSCKGILVGAEYQGSYDRPGEVP